jgi:hypothetical protein
LGFVDGGFKKVSATHKRRGERIRETWTPHEIEEGAFKEPSWVREKREGERRIKAPRTGWKLPL